MMERNRFIKVRVSPDEKLVYTQRQEASGEKTLSDWIRRQCLRDPIVDAESARLSNSSERTRALSKIGNNLNQLARLCHTHKRAPEMSEIQEIAQVLRGLK